VPRRPLLALLVTASRWGPPLRPRRGDAADAVRGAVAARGGNGSAARPFATIGRALQVAVAGDTVRVAAGTYRERLRSVRSGRANAPIRIVGARGAHVVGTGITIGRLLEIDRRLAGGAGAGASHADKLLWVQHATGVRLLGNRLHDAGGECVRVKYFAHHVEIARNRIERCGRAGFDLAAGYKNGEGVYLGTAPEQLDRNPTHEPDRTTLNWVHDNLIRPRAECVDVKESASWNLVEPNTCADGEDPEGAGFSWRGEHTIFRANISTGHAGAGIRLGGDTGADGLHSDVIGNLLSGNRGYGLKVLRPRQGRICGNRLAGNAKGATNDEVCRRPRPADGYSGTTR
jgi:uncharacterized protein DUF1565